jgi:hypothetical protein
MDDAGPRIRHEHVRADDLEPVRLAVQRDLLPALARPGVDGHELLRFLAHDPEGVAADGDVRRQGGNTKLGTHLSLRVVVGHGVALGVRDPDAASIGVDPDRFDAGVERGAHRARRDVEAGHELRPDVGDPDGVTVDGERRRFLPDRQTARSPDLPSRRPTSPVSMNAGQHDGADESPILPAQPPTRCPGPGQYLCRQTRDRRQDEVRVRS